MRASVLLVIPAVAGLFLAGCGAERAAVRARSQEAVTTRPAADAVIYVNGLSCPF